MSRDKKTGSTSVRAFMILSPSRDNHLELDPLTQLGQDDEVLLTSESSG